MPLTDRTSTNGKKNGAAPISKWEQAMKDQRKQVLSWADVGAEDLAAAVAAVTEDGAALLLSKTSDGGALLLQVLIGEGNKPKFYATTMTELNECLAAISSIQ